MYILLENTCDVYECYHFYNFVFKMKRKTRGYVNILEIKQQIILPLVGILHAEQVTFTMMSLNIWIDILDDIS